METEKYVQQVHLSREAWELLLKGGEVAVVPAKLCVHIDKVIDALVFVRITIEDMENRPLVLVAEGTLVEGASVSLVGIEKAFTFKIA